MRDKTFYLICITGMIALLLTWVCRKKLKLRIVANPIKRTEYLQRGGCALLLLISYISCFAAKWYVATYGDIGFDSIMYTMTADMAGVDPDLIKSFLEYMLYDPRAWFWIGVVVLILFSCDKKLIIDRLARKQLCIYPFSMIMTLVLSLVLSGGFLWDAAENTAFFDFIRNGMTNSTLFEEEYVAPETVNITFPEQKRNLIYIYLESMETAFLSEELGGALSHNTIPELAQFAQENINFSGSDGIGGFLTPAGTTWTIAGLVGQTAGVPLKKPVGDTGYGWNGDFLPGVTTITNILRENGYKQAFVMGSDAMFGCRKQYFTAHGMEDIYDYLNAPENGIIEEGYFDGNWGMEDLYLFEYTKQVLSRIAQEGVPFAVNLLTVDTHFPDGMRCELCDDTYAEQYENVFRCSSAQVAAFMQWCKEQSWYENTTIVIVGDHLTMDGAYIGRNVGKDYDRRVYNCIVNAAVEPVKEKNREFSTFDMFPTTLAAIGCTIEGNRLGLGTNLFSEVPTLIEEMGREQFDSEVSRFSEYYANNFWY